MGIDFTLGMKDTKQGMLGRMFGGSPTRMKEIGGWLCEHFVRGLASLSVGDGEKPEWVSVTPFPSAESIDVTFNKGVYVIKARTSALGPGYHVRLVDALVEMAGELGFEWVKGKGFEDETGYFESRERRNVYDAMHRFLGALASSVLEMGASGDTKNLAVCMPPGFSPMIECFALTPLGPRDRDWFRRVAADGSAGADFWAIYGHDEAEFHRGIATLLMWQEVRWRKPLDEAETELLRAIVLCLQRCHIADSTRELPAHEAKELLDFLQEDESFDKDFIERLRRSAMSPASREPLGYRRGDICKTLPGGWSIILPGRFQEAFEENADIFYDELLTIHFTGYKVDGKKGEGPPAAESLFSTKEKPEAVERFERKDKDTIKRGELTREEVDETIEWVFITQNAVAGRIAVFTFAWRGKREMIDEALRIWESVKAPIKAQPEWVKREY